MTGRDVNRRDALKAGGVALGGLGALAMTNASARAEPWSWSPQGSVAGQGAGADPRTVWDPEADAVIANVLERHNVNRINAELRTWVRNGQEVPSGLPAELRDFIEYARILPRGPTTTNWPAASSSPRSRGPSSRSSMRSPVA